MRMAVREMRRRPRTFVVPTTILTLLALLLLYPASILDGLMGYSTEAIRNLPADLVVYSHHANGVLQRSEILPDVRDRVAAVPNTAVSTYDVFPMGATIEGMNEQIGVALAASDKKLAAKAPAPGEAIADANMRTRFGLREGSNLLVGPSQVPVRVVGFASGTNLFFMNGLSVHRATLAQAVTGVEYDAAAANAGASQLLLVSVAAGADSNDVATEIDRATGGTTRTFTRDQAVNNLPGIAEQQGTFDYMRGITLLVALVVVALFLSFMTLERAPLYAALKAFGAASRQLFGALVLQVLVVTATAIAIAALITYGLTRLPSNLITVMLPGRLVETTVALGFTAILGACISLRRVTNVDPAEAIG